MIIFETFKIICSTLRMKNIRDGKKKKKSFIEIILIREILKLHLIANRKKEN